MYPYTQREERQTDVSFEVVSRTEKQRMFMSSLEMTIDNPINMTGIRFHIT